MLLTNLGNSYVSWEGYLFANSAGTAQAIANEFRHDEQAQRIGERPVYIVPVRPIPYGHLKPDLATRTSPA